MSIWCREMSRSPSFAPSIQLVSYLSINLFRPSHTKITTQNRWSTSCQHWHLTILCDEPLLTPTRTALNSTQPLLCSSTFSFSTPNHSFQSAVCAQTTNHLREKVRRFLNLYSIRISVENATQSDVSNSTKSWLLQGYSSTLGSIYSLNNITPVEVFLP